MSAQEIGMDNKTGIELACAHKVRLLALDYGIDCLVYEGYAHTAAAEVRKVRDWLAASSAKDAADQAELAYLRRVVDVESRLKCRVDGLSHADRIVAIRSGHGAIDRVRIG